MSSAAISFEEYRQIDAVSASQLKHLLVSPKHYRWEMDHPKAETDAMRLGRATHTAVLEPDKFLREYALWDGGRRFGKRWDAFCEANADRTILTEAQYEECLAIRDAVHAHPVASKLLQSGTPEHSLQWVHHRTGLTIKSRLDYLGAVLVDVKTTRDTTPARFVADACRRFYPMQLSLYADGVATVHRRTPPVAIVAAQNCPPYDVVVFELPESVLTHGRLQYERALDTLLECQENGAWPGISNAPLPFELPRWIETENDDDTDDF